MQVDVSQWQDALLGIFGQMVVACMALVLARLFEPILRQWLVELIADAIHYSQRK